MRSDAVAYNAYAREVLMPAMDQDALGEIQALESAGAIEDPRYMELLSEHHYVQHILRMPLEDWPKPVHNPAIYASTQGPSELVISADAKLARWSRFDHLATVRSM
jgi:proline iminopeptidase